MLKRGWEDQLMWDRWLACATAFCVGVRRDDGSIPGEYCEILICSYLRHFINFNLSVVIHDIVNMKLPRDMIYVM